MNDELLIHYYELPGDIYISFKDKFHNKLRSLAQAKTKHYFKNCFYKILNCPKFHAQRLYNKDIRFNLKEFELLRENLKISKEEAEKYIENIGNHEDGTIIKNPKFPFKLQNIIYVASHLFFDGSFRLNKGNYFCTYDEGLLEYHKKRLKQFGDVPINFIEKENQLYFSYTLGYIAKYILNINTFNSTSCFLSKKIKDLTKKYKLLADEIIKALILDEGSIEDKVKIELANERLVKDLYEIMSNYYKLRTITYRKRFIRFKNNPTRAYISNSWHLAFASENIKELYKSISPLSISYKEDALNLLTKRRFKKGQSLKKGITKKLIVKLLLKNTKTLYDLSNELNINMNSLSRHINGGNPTYSTPLNELGITKKVGEKILKRGGYAKSNIYGIANKEKALNYIKN